MKKGFIHRRHLKTQLSPPTRMNIHDDVGSFIFVFVATTSLPARIRSTQLLTPNQTQRLLLSKLQITIAVIHVGDFKRRNSHTYNNNMKFTSRVLLTALALGPTAAAAATTTAERTIQEEFDRALETKHNLARQLQQTQGVCTTHGPYSGVSQTLPESILVAGSYSCGDGTVFVSAFWSSNSDAVTFNQPVDPTTATFTMFGSYEACMNVLCYNPTTGVSDTIECCTTVEMIAAPGSQPAPVAGHIPGKPTPPPPPGKPSPSPTVAPRKPSPSPTITPRPPTRAPTTGAPVTRSPVARPTGRPSSSPVKATAKPTWEPTPRPTFRKSKYCEMVTLILNHEHFSSPDLTNRIFATFVIAAAIPTGSPSTAPVKATAKPTYEPTPRPTFSKSKYGETAKRIAEPRKIAFRPMSNESNLGVLVSIAASIPTTSPTSAPVKATAKPTFEPTPRPTFKKSK
jgi:hypothetical protein